METITDRPATIETTWESPKSVNDGNAYTFACTDRFFIAVRKTLHHYTTAYSKAPFEMKRSLWRMKRAGLKKYVKSDLLAWPFVSGPSTLRVVKHGLYYYMLVRSVDGLESYHLKTKKFRYVTASAHSIFGVCLTSERLAILDTIYIQKSNKPSDPILNAQLAGEIQLLKDAMTALAERVLRETNDSAAGLRVLEGLTYVDDAIELLSMPPL